MDEKCRQKAELGFAKCNFQNSGKKYLAYGVRTFNNCFCLQKAQMNFTQSSFAKCNFRNSDKKFSAYGVCTKQLFLPSKKAK